jgi:hypothetical protein
MPSSLTTGDTNKIRRALFSGLAVHRGRDPAGRFLANWSPGRARRSHLADPSAVNHSVSDDNKREAMLLTMRPLKFRIIAHNRERRSRRTRTGR